MPDAKSESSQADLTEQARWSLHDVMSLIPVHGTTPALALTYDKSAPLEHRSAVLHALRTDGSEIWNVSLGLPVDGVPAVGSDGTVYAAAAPCVVAHSPVMFQNDLDRDHAIVALDPATGAEKWRAPMRTGMAGGASGSVQVNPVTGDVYAHSNGINTASQFHAIHADGSPAWDRWFFTAIVGSDGTLYGFDEAKLTAFSPSNAVLWRSELQMSTITAGPSLGSDGTIYLGSWHGDLYAVARDGKAKWTRKISNTALRGAPLVRDDGSIFIETDASGYTEDLLGLDSSGTLQWKLPGVRRAILGPAGTVLASTLQSAGVCEYDGVTGMKSSCVGDKSMVVHAFSNGLVYATELALVGGGSGELVVLRTP